MTTRAKYRKGLEKEPNTVYIGRPFGPFKDGSKWGNPYKTGRDGSLEEVLTKYETYVKSKQDLMDALGELKDKILICWCKDDAGCHGDVLIKLLEE